MLLLVERGLAISAIWFQQIWLDDNDEEAWQWSAKHEMTHWLKLVLKLRLLREAVKNYLADCFRYGGTPPTPLAENHFSKKP